MKSRHHSLYKLDALSSAQVRRSVYQAVLMMLYLPPFIGGSLMVLMQIYPFPEFYFVFASYGGLYVVLVSLLAFWAARRLVRFVISIPERESADLDRVINRVLKPLPWYLLFASALYSIGGAISASYSLQALGYLEVDMQLQIKSMLGLVPVVLMTVFPIYFSFVDDLGRYLGPRGVGLVAIPMWMKLVMLGLFTPLMIDSMLLMYFYNKTGQVTFDAFLIWFVLLAIAAVSTYFAVRSFNQGLYPMEQYFRKSPLESFARGHVPTPISLDETGALAAHFAQLLQQNRHVMHQLEREKVFSDAVLENAGALVMVLGRDGRVQRFNKACEELTHYRFDEVQGQYAWDFLLRDQDGMELKRTLKLSQGGMPEFLRDAYSGYLYCKDGARRLVQWTNSSMLDSVQHLEYIILVGMDITEKRSIENMLAERLRHQRALLNVISKLEKAGSFVEIAEVVEREISETIQYKRSRLILGDKENNHVMYMVIPEQFAALGNKLEAYPSRDFRDNGYFSALLDVSEIQITNDIRTVPGLDPEEVKARALVTVIHVPLQMKSRRHGFLSLGSTENEGVRIPGEAEKDFLRNMAGYVAAACDRITFTRELQESDERLKDVMRVSPVGIFTTSAEGKCTYANDAWTHITGMSIEEAYGDGWSKALLEEDRDKVFTEWNAAVADDRPFQMEYRFKSKDGNVRWVLGKAVAQKDDEGKIRHFVGSITDFTELRHARDEIEQHRNNLEKLVEIRTRELKDAQANLLKNERLATLGQLTATVSHELRNPLGSMRPSLFLLRKALGENQPKQAAAIDRIDRAISRCDRIIDEMLDFTRIRDLDLMDVQMDYWVEMIVNEFQVPEGVDLRFVPGLGKTLVSMDQDRLRRCLINLVENAFHAVQERVDFREKGGLVRVSTLKEEPRYTISVEDDGTGMSEETVEKIFEPLFSTKTFGVGLGMPTVLQIMQQHGGGVDVESIKGKGTKMVLWLPVLA